MSRPAALHPLAACPLVLPCMLLLAARAAWAGDVPFFYTVEERGQVLVQGTLLETLTGDFDPQDLFQPKGTDRWVDFAVEGDQRYALRLDGRIERNGEFVVGLPFVVANYVWQRLLVDGGAITALRSDGLLSLDGQVPLELPDDGFIFYDLAAAGGHVYALRADGAVFRDDDPTTPIADFDGGKGTLEHNEGKSTFGDSHWTRLRLDPNSGLLLALRGDGKLQTLDPGTAEIVELPDLPFPKKEHNVRLGDLYADLETQAGGPWTVLRNDGRIYDELSPGEPLVDLPGKPRQRNRHEYYVDLVLDGGSSYALRRDGLLASGTTGQTLVTLDGLRWIKLAATPVTPVLEGADSHPPEAAVLRVVHAVQGQALSIPIVVSDIDDPTEALELSADLTHMPGATFDAGSSRVNWPVPSPTGKTRFVLSVDDGSPQPREFTYDVRVRPPHTAQGNTRPEPSRYERIQALVGVPLVVPMLAVDRDGDPLSFQRVLFEGAFTQGASFDTNTNSLLWTPDLADLGKTTARVEVSDEERTRTIRLRIEVVSPLHFPAR